MEWVKPIHVLEYEFRRQGVFLLVDAHLRKLWFYGFKSDQADINRMRDSMKGRVDEMVKFLIARASVKG